MSQKISQQDLREIFKKEFGYEAYNHLFSNMEYIVKSNNNDILLIIVPNIYIEQWIKTQYNKKILEIFEKYFKTQPEIHINKETKKTNVKSFKQNIQKTQNSLNPSYTFETFIQGDSNKFAYEIAKQVCEKQSERYNPVLFYGGTGLGKTHLLNAIGNKVIEKDKIVIYITAEQFLNDYISKIQSNNMESFREKYRNCDYLLIDDVQFFGGKQQIQDEFFHTFNELHTKKKQIIMTADKSLKQITGLAERLKSRFEWGITADIQPPGLETKIEIIKQKCVINHIELSKDIIEYLASNVGENIRQIEGITLKLNALSFFGQSITLTTVENAIKDIQKEPKKNPSIDDIIKAVARKFNIKPSEISSKSKVKSIAKARKIVIFITRQMIPNSMTMIAQSLNMKDHSAVSKAISSINKEIKENPTLQSEIDEIKNKL
ncbi:chromosomal replication initiator protein DnaA [Helicobacter anatolicus]|uniref:chromosomal replication initiator protein DnaA n=1 Tax=Helicobacter anatolicus TaxID=2905874 RepID=UPI001E60C242|nr:chromosomal replication initiator protein DnaA [Helicobacter anatolicus]MCE3037092.1 chromosomal replication initiator protein DnaA [Helicobacter anatolicus]MCE3040082.1 chromosomal replication initiator protein DnaA [Helicobacter anatolicus]